ncbi:MAG: NADH-quinone oxidoreductase subunit NuoN, partial [Vampirovibrio sp.]|nr:NADH-quinone oxidoreductase subunit NuoN [Vampirovibrio sp.]
GLNGINSSSMEMLWEQTLKMSPEVTVLLGVLATLFIAMLAPKEGDAVPAVLKGPMKILSNAWLISVVFLILTLVYLVFQAMDIVGSGAEASVFYGMFKLDMFSLMMRFMMVLGALVVVLFSRYYVGDVSPIRCEYYALLLGALLGGMLLSGATDLVMLFVALETLGISSFIMVGWARGDAKSAEASLKYLLYGGATTAILLFGFSLLFAISGGHTSFVDIVNGLQRVGDLTAQGSSAFLIPLIPVMMVLILGAFAFKISAAPFHMWTPDVYEGAPTPVTAFLSVVSKIAGFAVLIRFLGMVMNGFVEPTFIVTIFAVLSMTIGNWVALSQTDIKRLLAYSTIAHAGYILLGLAVMTADGMAGMVFYLLTYVFMNLGAFISVIFFSRETGSTNIADYAGLVQKRPILTFCFTMFLLSLAGIPITAGFFAKFFLFQSVAAAGNQYLWLIVVALLNSTVSLYYYLKVIKLMVIAEPSPAVVKLGPDQPYVGSFPAAMAMSLCLLMTLVLGFFADPCMQISKSTVQQLAHQPQVQDTTKVVSQALP